MIQYDSRSFGAVLLRFQGSVFPKVALRTVLVAAVGVVAVLTHEWYRITLPVVVHSLIGVALGLLLVFRTNASYDRYWEGRKLLGAMVNRTRDLVRQAAAYLDDASAARELRRHVSLYYAVAAQTLQQRDDLGRLDALLTDAERAALAAVTHRAPVVSVWIAQRIARERRAGHLTELQAYGMDQNLTALLDALGGAERILRTPIPFAYAQHIKVFVVTYVFTAPFALVEATGWFAPAAAAVLALALLGIEQIGVEIEDPFGDDPNDLPVLDIGRGIDRATTEMIEQGALPAHDRPEGDALESAAPAQHHPARD